MMSVLEYAEDVNKTVSEILNLCKKLNIPVYLQDERLTTRQAESLLIKNDTSRKKRKKVVDRYRERLSGIEGIKLLRHYDTCLSGTCEIL